jgi:hypothetical protein
MTTQAQNTTTSYASVYRLDLSSLLTNASTSASTHPPHYSPTLQTYLSTPATLHDRLATGTLTAQGEAERRRQTERNLQIVLAGLQPPSVSARGYPAQQP